MIFILLLIAAVTLGYIYIKWSYTYWKRLNVPHPEPTFLVGNVGKSLSMTSHISLLVEKWYRDFPNAPYVGYYKVLSPGIIVRDPDLVKEVLIKDHFSFHVNEQDFSKRFDPLMQYNPFVAAHEGWRKSRTVLTPLLTLYKVRQLHPLTVDTCNKMADFLKCLPTNKDVEAKSLAARFATQNIINCSFSIDPKCFTGVKTEFRQMGKKIFQPTSSSGVKLMLMSICPILREILPYAFVPFDVDDWFRGLIMELKKARSKEPLEKEDLFQTILNSAEKHNINDEELAGYSLTLFTEGYETSSTTLAFAIYEMARNPDIQERLHEEITDVLAKYNNEFTFDALQEMKYLDMVVQETLRMNPAAPLISRLCTKEYTLPILDGQKEPVTIYPGTPIQVSVIAIHRDPKLYPDPDVFDPTRFTVEEQKNRHKGIYLPWGEGPRMCTGIKFAMAQTKSAVMAIVRDFKITLSPNHKPFVFDINAFLYQARDGLLVNFTPRK